MLKGVSVFFGVVASTTFSIDLSVIPPEMNPVLYEECLALMSDASLGSLTPVEPPKESVAEELAAVTAAEPAKDNPCIALNREYRNRIVEMLRDLKGEFPCTCMRGQDLETLGTVPFCEPGCTEVIDLDLRLYEANMEFINSSNVAHAIWGSFHFNQWMDLIAKSPSARLVSRPRFSPELENALVLIRFFSGEADEHCFWYYMVTLESPETAARHFVRIMTIIGLRISILIDCNISSSMKPFVDCLLAEGITLSTGGLSLQALARPSGLEAFGSCRIASRALVSLLQDIKTLRSDIDFRHGMVLRGASDVFLQLHQDANLEKLELAVRTTTVDGETSEGPHTGSSANETLKQAALPVPARTSRQIDAHRHLHKFFIPTFSIVPIGFMHDLALECVQQLEVSVTSLKCMQLVHRWMAINYLKPVESVPVFQAPHTAQQAPMYDASIQFENEIFESNIELMGVALMRKGPDARALERMFLSPAVVSAIRSGAALLGLDVAEIESKWQRDIETQKEVRRSSATGSLQSDPYAREVLGYAERFYATSTALTTASSFFHVENQNPSLSRRMKFWKCMSETDNEDEAAQLVLDYFKTVFELQGISEALREQISSISPQIDVLMAQRDQIDPAHTQFIVAAHDLIENGLPHYARLALLMDGYDLIVDDLMEGVDESMKKLIVQGFMEKAGRILPVMQRALTGEDSVQESTAKKARSESTVSAIVC